MSLFSQLAVKPWESVPGDGVDAHLGKEFNISRGLLGLRVLMAVLTVFFSLMIVTYADRMTIEDWHTFAKPWLLWMNTVVLILASVSLHWATISSRSKNTGSMKLGLFVGGTLSLLFLVGQILVWRQLDGSGYFSLRNPATSFFYLLTAVHGLHVVGGLVAWIRTVTKLGRGQSVEQVRPSVELCAVYAHYLLAVWLVLFSLMLVT